MASPRINSIVNQIQTLLEAKISSDEKLGPTETPVQIVTQKTGKPNIWPAVVLRVPGEAPREKEAATLQEFKTPLYIDVWMSDQVPETNAASVRHVCHDVINAIHEQKGIYKGAAIFLRRITYTPFGEQVRSKAPPGIVEYEIMYQERKT